MAIRQQRLKAGIPLPFNPDPDKHLGLIDTQEIGGRIIMPYPMRRMPKESSSGSELMTGMSRVMAWAASTSKLGISMPG